MKKNIFWISSISILVFVIFWYACIGFNLSVDRLNDDKQNEFNMLQVLNLQDTDKDNIDNVQICAQPIGTECETNSDCDSGNCYAGICQPCEVAGMMCTNDGNCCKSDCSGSYCGGEDEWAPVYAVVGIVGGALGVGSAGLVGKIGFNYKGYADQSGELNTEELEQDMDDIINSQRGEELEADLEYAEENPETVMVTAEDDEDYLEENSSEVSDDWDEDEATFDEDVEPELESLDEEVQLYAPEIEETVEATVADPADDAFAGELALDLLADGA